MFKRIAAFFGTGARAFVALVGIIGISLGVANYDMTQGAGTTFGSALVSSVHYAKQLICDQTAPTNNCAAVVPGNTITQNMTAIAVGVTNTLTSISMGDGITTGNFPSGSPVFAGIFNGTSYDRPRSAGPIGFTAVTNTPFSLANGHALISGTLTTAMVGVTSTQLITAITSNRIYITRIKCNNSSATASLVQVRDGTAGSVLDTLAAGATYGGEQGTGSTPLFWTTVGTGLFVQNVTNGASVLCTASGYAG